MVTVEPKAVVRRLIEEAWNRGNLAAVDALVAPGFVYHRPPPGVPPTREGFRQVIAASRAAFPDQRVKLEDVIAEGDRVAARYTFRGTHQGPLFGVPPTGKPVAVTGIVILRVASGQLAERWENADELGLLQQLGVVPAPGA